MLMSRKLLIGCGVLLALGVLLFLTLIAGVMIGGDNQLRDTTNQAPKNSSQPKNVEVAVGEAAKLRDRTLVVNEVERNYPPPNRSTRIEPGNELVRVYITLKNTSNQTFPYNPNNFKVQDSNGVQKTPQSYSDIPYRVGAGDLASGGTLEGNMVYEVPEGDTGLKLVYEPFESRTVGSVTVTF